MARQSDIRLRRSATQNSVPTTSQLNLGELAINTYDGKLFLKKNVGGNESIVEVGANNLADTFQIYEYSVTSSQTTFSGSDDNSNTLSYTTGSPPRVAVYLNGLLLDWGTDFTATNGTSVVLTSAAASGDLVQIQAYKSTVVAGSNLLFNDNIKAQFGNDGDLEIFHNGSNSIINEVGTGVLKFQVGGTGIFEVRSAGIVMSSGKTITGTISDISNHDTDSLSEGSSNLYFTNARADARIAAANTGDLSEGSNLYFTNERVDDRVAALLTAGTGISLSYDDTAGTLQITGVAAYGDSDVESYLDANGLTLPDDVKAQFGAGNDLQIYSDGNSSFIKEVSSTGSLHIDGSHVYIRNGSGNENIADFISNDAVKLYFDNSIKLVTKSDGVDITGELQSDSLDVDGAADISGNLTIGGNLTVNGTTTTLNTATLTVDDLNITLADGAADKSAANGAGITIDCGSDTDATITYVSASDRFDFNNGIKSTGNLTLENTAPKIFLTDSDNNSDFQIINNNGTYTIYDGTNSASRFTINSSGNANFSGSVTASSFVGNVTGNVSGSAATVTGAAQSAITSLGTLTSLTVDDITIDGSTISDSGDLTLDIGGDITIDADGGDIILKDGGTQFGKFTQLIGGLAIGAGSGTDIPILVSSTKVLFFKDINLGDDEKIQFGDGADGNLQIFHDGTDSFIDDVAEGNIVLRTNGDSVKMMAGSENMVVATKDGAVTLYHNNSSKLATSSSGVSVTGSIDVSDSAEIGDYKIDTTSTSTSSTSVATIHSFAAASFRSARYTIQVTNSTDSSYHTTEVLMVHDGTDANIAEYGTIFTVDPEATFDADISSGNVRLLATPASADSMTFKVICHSITV